MACTLHQLINDPHNVSARDAGQLSRRYPYFVYPLIAALKGDCTQEERIAFKRLIAAHVGDTDTLLDLFGPDGDVFADFYPDMHAPDPSTDDTIDNFLNKFGSKAGLQSDPLNFAPTVDYAAILEAEEKGGSSPGRVVQPSELQDLEFDDEYDVEEEEAEEEVQSAKVADSTPLTESLARMMIKNGNYAKALEIINDLNLKNPEKSVYFADQIRFLKKLILNKNNS